MATSPQEPARSENVPKPDPAPQPVPAGEAAGNVNMRSRLDILETRISTLDGFREMSLQQFVASMEEVEHKLSLIAQSIVDICNTMLLVNKGVHARSYYDIIDQCQKFRLLPKGLTERLARDLVLVDGGVSNVQASEILQIHENMAETIRTFRLFHQHVMGMMDGAGS
jgi:hypothetical protein